MKIILADDHTLFRDALVQYIERAEPDSDVETSEDFNGVLKILSQKPYQDLILLDFRMPGMNGLDGLKLLRKEYPNIPVVIMSGVAESTDVHNAIELGAAGYFPKTLSGKVLLEAIQHVLRGEQFIPVDHSNNVLPSYFTDKEDKGGPIWESVSSEDLSGSAKELKLTPREMDVLFYLGKGMSNKEIAHELELQVVTIKLHVRGICKKLDVNNRTQAALKAHDLGLVSNTA